jgi:NADPH:quinone reductase-like Zn-dependent oxidoreductase
MKAAVVTAPKTSPIYADFAEPIAQEGQAVVTVTASALTNLTRGRASGAHYSSDGQYPLVPGQDGVGRTANGQRIYFAQPVAPFGAMAQQTLIRPKFTVPVPGGLDDVTAAALANPGMSAWAALMERARFLKGETVLINGATGSAGRVAVQLAKYLGASRIIATGRNQEELEQVKLLGAGETLLFNLGMQYPNGEKQYEEALIDQFGKGIDVVLDYLWGDTARTIITAIARGVEDAHPVRFVQIGSAAGKDTIDLPSAALRSSAIMLMGSGLKSVAPAGLLNAVKNTFDVAVTTGLRLDVKAAPLSQVAEMWDAPGKPRIVFTID